MESSSRVRYTYQDLLSIPEDHRRYEIIDGELFVTAAPRFNHQKLAANLLRMLAGHADQHDLGELVAAVGVHIHDELVFQPDLLFIARDRFYIVDPEGDVHGPPDLVIEILSPSTRSYDRDVKRKRYLEHGVGEVWLVDAEARRVEVWRPGADEPERVEDVLVWRVGEARLDIALADVFRGV